MRLLSLALNGQYKGLKDQTFSFENADDHVIAFIGLNGSGKSQLLELIAECFAYLERLQRHDFKDKGHLGFDFTLNYSMSGYVNQAPFSRVEVFGNKLNVADGFADPKFKILVKDNKVESIALKSSESAIAIGIESLPLPHIVGYSSGLNENLQRPFLKNANQLFKALRARAKYHKEKRKIEMAYELRNSDSELAFNIYLSNKKELVDKFRRNHAYLFDFDAAEYTDDDLALPETATHPSNLVYLDYDSAQFAVAFIDFEYQALITQHSQSNKDRSNLTFTIPTSLALEFDFTQPNVADEVVDDIKSFIRLAETGNGTTQYLGKKTTAEEYDYYELDFLKGLIELDLTELAKESQLSTFGTLNPVRLFERLYKVQQLGIKNIRAHDRKLLEKDGFLGAVKKPLKVKLPLMAKSLELKNSGIDSVAYEELSDGESQLLQILAVIKLYTHENTLFLLDEPETHLNPAWRTSFHSYLTNALRGKNGKTKSQALLSTHSPFMVSSLKRNNVYQFRRSDDGLIDMKVAQNETYGASFDVLIKDLFDLRSLISQSVIDEIREQLKQGDDNAREWIEANLGLSAEKAYLIRKLSQ
ncbi:AAA family ATPase [Pseudoalteromonas sp. MMG012]|uniref:AAA family ATPase n=1 Tax=Pseudoalteromonas sp. MMG012 TaxID=2822686 RepID=UPI001B3A443C|nr:AAA family ATPase [Pseudoalteromonas sp. MMG012]MBQ4851090.1 AAA family ATPase [Pseudoalteromonas sp. MMG012]